MQRMKKKPDENNIAGSEVALLLLRSHTAIAPLLLRCCLSCCLFAVTPAIASFVAPLLLLCGSTVTPLSLRCRSAIAPFPLLLLICRFCSSVPAAVNYAIATLSLPLLLLLSLHYHYCCRSSVALMLLLYCYVISPPSLRCCFAAAAVTPAVAPAIAPTITPLLSI